MKQFIEGMMKKFWGKCAVAFYIAVVFVGSLFKKRASGDPHAILIIATFRLGDIVFSTPLFRALKLRFPESSITVLAQPAFSETLMAQDFVDNVIAYKGKQTHASLVRMLRLGHYDLSVNICDGFLNTLVYAAGIGRRIGFLQKHPRKERAFLTDPVVFSGEFHGASQFFLHLLEPLGIYDADADPIFEACSSSFLNAVPFDSSIRTIVLHPGSAEKIKIWPYYSDLAARLIEKYHVRVILTGSADEGGSVDSMTSGDSIVDLRGKTSLKELAVLYSYADIVIGNDTGPIHFARSLGAKTLAIFGPSSKIVIGGENDDICIETSLSCRPRNACFFGIGVQGFPRCKNFSCSHCSCMASITVERVLRKVEQIMGDDLYLARKVRIA